jgi:hypothetical protein
MPSLLRLFAIHHQAHCPLTLSRNGVSYLNACAKHFLWMVMLVITSKFYLVYIYIWGVYEQRFILVVEAGEEHGLLYPAVTTFTLIYCPGIDVL